MQMQGIEWKMTFCWVNAHAGLRGNKLDDILTKKAATNKKIRDSYNKIPKSVVTKELEEESLKKWQRKCTQTNKERTK